MLIKLTTLLLLLETNSTILLADTTCGIGNCPRGTNCYPCLYLSESTSPNEDPQDSTDERGSGRRA